MTMERYRRCQHCQTVYLCLTSGSYGYHTDHRNPRYCEECETTINEALSKVRVKFKRVWKPVHDVTLEQLLEWEKTTNEEQAAQKGIVGRRVSAPLFRMDGLKVVDTQKAAYVRGRDKFKHRYFHYRYWKGEEDEAEITEEVEFNVETGQTRPWENLYEL